MLNGENKAYYETGTPLHTLNYKDGKKTGKNYYYYPKGSAKEIQIYEYTNEQSRVSIKRFYENEQLKENGSYSIKDSQDPNGWIKDGEWIGYFESGKLKYKELYLNGKKHLDLTYYFEKGLVQREEHYTHNLKQGRWLSYFEDGKLETEVTYKNNVLYGIYKEFYATGLLKLQGHYTGGKKTGDWKYHTPSGILEKTEHYKNDVLIKTKVIH